MHQQPISTQPANPGRLLTVANIQSADSNRKVTAWFFETPQIFEFELDAAGQNMFKLLQEAKEKALPVNVSSSVVNNKNRITAITPATPAQLDQYNKEKALRAQPVAVPPPGNK